MAGGAQWRIQEGAGAKGPSPPNFFSNVYSYCIVEAMAGRLEPLSPLPKLSLGSAIGGAYYKVSEEDN